MNYGVPYCRRIRYHLLLTDQRHQVLCRCYTCGKHNPTWPPSRGRRCISRGDLCLPITAPPGPSKGAGPWMAPACAAVEGGPPATPEAVVGARPPSPAVDRSRHRRPAVRAYLRPGPAAVSVSRGRRGRPRACCGGASGCNQRRYAHEGRSAGCLLAMRGEGANPEFRLRQRFSGRPIPSTRVSPSFLDIALVPSARPPRRVLCTNPMLEFMRRVFTPLTFATWLASRETSRVLPVNLTYFRV